MWLHQLLTQRGLPLQLGMSSPTLSHCYANTQLQGLTSLWYEKQQHPLVVWPLGGPGADFLTTTTSPYPSHCPADGQGPEVTKHMYIHPLVVRGRLVCGKD